MVKLEIADGVIIDDKTKKHLISEFEKASYDLDENDEFTFIIDGDEDKLLFWVEKEKDLFKIIKVFDKEHIL
ncbi:MAG: hypothetical protein N2448_05470 [Caloramator sp.]|nr:hypothetical protein [Caloramator sp.]